MADIKLHKVKPLSVDEIAAKPSRRMYPSFNIGLTALPDAKSWKVGKEYELRIRAVLRRLSVDKGGDGEVIFDISAIGGREAGTKRARYSRIKK